MLGSFKDDLDILDAAIAYLNRPPLDLSNLPPLPSGPVVDVAARVAPRTAQILQWRTEGVVFPEIGRRLGISKQRATQLWQRAQSYTPLYHVCPCGTVLPGTAAPGRPRKYCSPKCRPRSITGFELTREQYNRLVQLQNDLCAICQRRETGRSNSGGIRSLAIDHDHRTGTVRGLLCTNCNFGLGKVDDDLKILRSAAVYLRRHHDAVQAA